MASTQLAHQAHVDDCYSDDSDAGVHRPSVPRMSSPTAQANVSTKRSKDLNSPAPEKTMPANIDLRSDSGYSSFTAASKSSADSAPSATSRSPPVLPPAPTPVVSHSAPATKNRRPTVGADSRQHSTESSPRQRPAPISRTASVSSKQPRPSTSRRPTATQPPREKREAECNDPNCNGCGANAPQQGRRPRAETSSAATTMSTTNSDPNPYYSPPSPTYNRPYSQYAQGPAIVQPNRTRRPSTARRPSTFAGEPGAAYWVPGMPAPYPSPPQEPRGPPVAYQNYPNMQHMQQMQYSAPIPPYMATGQQGNYYAQSTQPYEPQQRPSLSARVSSSYGQRTHQPPIITQEDNGPSQYSARFGRAQPATPNEQHMRGANMPKPKLLQYTGHPDDEGSESDSSGSDEEYDEHEATRRSRERALMPPPKTSRSVSQRPPLHHAKTTQVTERGEDSRREKRRQSVVRERVVHQEPRERERAPRVIAAPAPAPTRRASVSRPPHRHTQSEYDTRNGRVVVNNTRDNRRQSAYQSYEKVYNDYVKDRADDQYNAERRREKRSSRVIVEPARTERTERSERFVPGQFDDSDEEEEEEPEPVRVLASNRPRRKTESDPRKGKERPAEVKNRRAENVAEAYISSTRGSYSPFADQVNKAALTKKNRIPSEPSDSGSSGSKGSGNRTTMTNGTNNEIRLRVDGTMPLSLQLSGDMEGRTLQLVPAENGMTDLVIGGGNIRSGETVYRSERGSMSGINPNFNRRSLIAGQGRREAEEVSERSSRSARSRRGHDEIGDSREERAPVLRRRGHTTYH